MTTRSSAMELYFSTCRCVMQADPLDRESWTDLYRYLPLMRQAISCSVCGNILLKPLRPPHTICQHNICAGCVGGKFRLKPTCSWCKTHTNFVENSQMRLLILCFKKLCTYIYGSPIGTEISASTTNGETNSLELLLKEVIKFEDKEYTVGTTVSRLTMPVLTPVTVKNQKPGRRKLKYIGSNVANENSRSDPPTLHPIHMTSDDAITSSSDFANTTNNYVSSTDHCDQSSEAIPRSSTNHRRVHSRVRSQSLNLGLPKKVQFHRKSYDDKHHFFRRQQKLKQLKSQRISYEEKFLSQLPTKRLRTETTESEPKRKICKCARNNLPNILTCMGQRCPCYSNFMPCVGCLCRGCRNNRKGTSDKAFVPISPSGLRSQGQFGFLNSSSDSL
ncbi:E3 ubiquitin-protein ligase MSL2-like [Gigantopelta aegis]|uniref:E3 ubiquitin-protein ligase MSL2-like n=1 Tax=Gigantopelta aegis TaxID=1735272 RepID=UPI001B88BE9C|nr:E3 ubiquitin-protein ligase MSL2-like [Gigantopelta aegis]